MSRSVYQDSGDAHAAVNLEEPVFSGEPRTRPDALGESGTSIGQVTRQSAINMAGGLISQALKFFVVIYVARRFQVAEFGLLSFAIAVNAYVFIVSNFGLPLFGSRLIAKTGRVPRELIAEICCLRALLALAATALSVGMLALFPRVSTVELLLVAIFGLSNVAQAAILDWVFQGLQRQEISAILNVIWQGGWLALTVAGTQLKMGLLAVPSALVASALVASIAGYFSLRRMKVIKALSGDHPELLKRSWETLRAAAPLGWGSLLLTIAVWTDTIWVRLLRGDSSVGVYAAGNRGALALSMLGTFYVQGAFPLLSRMSEKSGPAFGRCLQNVYADLALLFLPGSLWAIFYAKEIIMLVFGRADYLSAVPVFRIFNVATLLFVMNNLLGTGVLVAFHRDRTFRKILGATSVLFLILSPAFTWFWGLGGSAAAVLATQAVSFLWFSVETRQLIRPNHLRAILKPVLAGMTAVGGGYFLRLPLFGAAATLVVAYVVLLILRARSLPPQEMYAIG